MEKIIINTSMPLNPPPTQTQFGRGAEEIARTRCLYLLLFSSPLKLKVFLIILSIWIHLAPPVNCSKQTSQLRLEAIISSHCHPSHPLSQRCFFVPTHCLASPLTTLPLLGLSLLSLKNPSNPRQLSDEDLTGVATVFSWAPVWAVLAHICLCRAPQPSCCCPIQGSNLRPLRTTNN